MISGISDSKFIKEITCYCSWYYFWKIWSKFEELTTSLIRLKSQIKSQTQREHPKTTQDVGMVHVVHVCEAVCLWTPRWSTVYLQRCYPVGENCPDSVTCTSYLSHCILSIQWVMALFSKLDSWRWPRRVAKCWCSIYHSRWIQGIWACDATLANFWRLTRHWREFLSPSCQCLGPSESLHWCGVMWLLHSQVVFSHSQLSLHYRDVRGHGWVCTFLCFLFLPD